MNWDRIEGNWKQFSGQARMRWGKLTDDHWSQIGGRKDDLIGRIQEAYGVGREEAERQVHEWSTGLSDDGMSGSTMGSAGMGGGMGGSGMGSGMGGGGMGEFSEQAQRWADEARHTAQQQAEQLAERIRQKPLGAIGAAAGIGLIIGLLLGR